MKKEFLNKKICSKQYWKKSEYEFDPDSSPISWSFYNEAYKNLDLLKSFNIQNLNFTGGRLLSKVKKDSDLSKECELWANFKLGGDCDFNFNEKKLKLFKKILSSDLNYKLIETLNYCSNMHHKPLNFSLMPVTGSINNLKGNLHIDEFEIIKLSNNSLDRFDTFISVLNLYYKNNDNLILKLSRNNKEPLINFLNKFKNTYDYCEKIYFIKDKSFVDKLIENGMEPIKDMDSVVRYINLAKGYWCIKENFLINIS